MKFLALLVAGFLFLASLEAWAGFWILGRWYVSSRYASVSLGTVKNWLDRSLVGSSIQTVKVFVQKHGKWILLTLGLSQVIPEVERLRNTTQACYIAFGDTILCHVGTLNYFFCYGTRDTRNYFTMYPEIIGGGDTCGFQRNIPAYSVYLWDARNNYWYRIADKIPVEGRHFIGRSSSGWECYLNVSVNIPPCPFPREAIAPYQSPVRGYPPSQVDWSQRRRIPVRVYPNPLDFIRPDVVEADPALRWLRDEYQRIANDPSIPLIPAGALGDLELPAIDWSISPDEALDHASESSRDLPREGEGSREGDVDLSVPGLNTDLEVPVKRPFPVELINQLVQNHPLLRILQSVSLDASGGGSCVFGSQPFVIDMCGWAWVLNLMGAFLVPLAFLYGLGIGGRND